jgi:protein TonB
MQAIQTSSNIAFKQLPTSPSTFVRIGVSIVAGGIITVGLFAAMQSLIEQDDKRPVIEAPIIIISPILDLQEEITNVRPKIKPLPEMKIQPIRSAEIPIEPSDNKGFANVISLPTVASEKLDFNINAVDQQPRAIVRIDPRYPAQAANNGVEGFVQLSFGVSASGEVVDIDVIESEPKRVFDNAAKQALRKWRYQPKMVSGTPVSMGGLQVRLDFTLAKD